LNIYVRGLSLQIDFAKLLVWPGITQTSNKDVSVDPCDLESV